MDAPVNEDRLRLLIKESLVELIREKREEMYDLIVEAMEDVAMGRAIEEGRKGKFVSEDEIMKMLKR